MIWRCSWIRHFSNSIAWKNFEKKPAEPSKPIEPTPPTQGYELSRMPTNFEKKLLKFAGKYKTVEEMPKLVTSETLDMVKSKIRIKVSNILIVFTLIACGGVIFEGKYKRKEKIRKLKEKEELKRAEGEQKETAQLSLISQ